jgi:alkanesulfonate monooxygenase SsuD/methylene tetrahydromethanopterin reductase-like flavin-dependent oxidoreductase (luciferase family)
LWLAGSSSKALERAGASFDGWLPYSPTPTQYAAEWAAVTASAKTRGRAGAITPGLYATVLLEDDPEHAQQALDRYCQAYYGFPLEVMRKLQALYGGPPAACARWIGEYIAAGAGHVVLRFGALGDPLTMARRAAEELLPLLLARPTGAPA